MNEILYGNTRHPRIGATIPKVVSAGEHATVPIGQFLTPTPSFYSADMDVQLRLHH